MLAKKVAIECPSTGAYAEEAGAGMDVDGAAGAGEGAGRVLS